ncbi:hypothetical protein I4U23_014476 [Adineta vaga]|nr:hypothetical protein I4U23_014476 [Adineta vaga]
MSHDKKIRKLNTDQLQELRHAFDLFDSDRSGGISVIELKQSLSALGVNVNDQQVKQIFSAIDVDKNGRIEFDEFIEIVADFYFKKHSRAEILDAFRRFDHNGDGFIEAEELQNILSQLGKKYSDDEVDLSENGYFFNCFCLF